MELTYSIFLEKTGFTEDTFFCKMLNSQLNQFIFQRGSHSMLDYCKFQYKLGLNEYNLKTEGLDFTTGAYLHNYVYSGVNIATIELCEDALFYIDPDNKNFFETNKFNITKIEQTEEMCEIAIRLCWHSFFDVKNKTENIYRTAVRTCGHLLLFIENQTEELCEWAVYQDGDALRYVKKQTERICELAVHQCGLSLKFVKKQTGRICRLAVQQNGLALQYVEEQTKEICEIAVKQNKLASQFAKIEWKTCVKGLFDFATHKNLFKPQNNKTEQ